MRSTDVLVLGGGVVGCAVALRLRQRGLAVTVVDRGEPGAEASSAAAGILAPQVEAHAPGPFLDSALASRARHPALAEELYALTGVDVGYRSDGTLAIAVTDAEVEGLLARQAWQIARGLTVERLTGAEAKEREPELGACLAALRFADDHQVDAPRLMAALATAAARAGVIFETAQARRVLHDGARVSGADLDGSARPAAAVVVACGPWSSLLEGTGLSPRAIVPVRGQMLELSCARPPLRHVVFGAGGYLVPRADGRVLCGLTEERVGFVKEVTPAGLSALSGRAARLCPPLAEARVSRSWAGLRPASADGLPFIGATGLTGLVLATGHYRNGVLLAPVTADAVAACLAGERPPAGVDLGPFSPLRLQ